jgi:hypothetical protein
MANQPTTRHFTLAEANALLPELEPLVGALLERRAKAVRRREELGDRLDEYHHNIGGPVASELTADFIAIEKLLEEIQSHGCIVKDLNAGLIDFPARRDGREVLLCWRYGEPQVEFYHELHTGFAGRKRVE